MEVVVIVDNGSLKLKFVFGDRLETPLEFIPLCLTRWTSKKALDELICMLKTWVKTKSIDYLKENQPTPAATMRSF